MNAIKWNGKEYGLAFTVNVMEAIQEEYGTLEKWGELTDGKNHEVNLKALKFGVCEMLNEALDIAGDPERLTLKQVGRMLTDISLDKMREAMAETVTDATKDERKNA